MLELLWNINYYFLKDGNVISASSLNIITNPTDVSLVMEGIHTIMHNYNATFGIENSRDTKSMKKSNSKSNFELQLQSINVTLLLPSNNKEDNDTKYPLTNNAEIILEECLTDYLSYISCVLPTLANRTANTNNNINDTSARNLCYNRLIVLGIEENHDDNIIDCCIDLAKCAFIEDLQMIQCTQDELLNDMNQTTDDGSASHTTNTTNYKSDIIDISIKNAVEKAISYVLESITFLENVKHELVLKFEGITVISDLGEVLADVQYISLRNGSGVFFWKCDSFDGAYPTSALQCVIKGDIDVTMGSVDVTFVSKDVIYAIESIQPILSTLSSNASSSKSANETTNANTKLDICIKQGNVIFTSDELIPFTRLVTFNLCIKNHNTVTYNNTNVWNISSNSFELWDDSPVGHSYPDVIMPLEEEQNESSNDLIIDIILPNDHWKYPTQVHVQIHKKRIIILKRYIEELFQYMDECYGIGKLTAKLMPHSIEVDEYNNPPPPLLWFCDIKESLLILPRNSSSMDIIGLQNNDKDSVIKFGNQFVPHTWKLNDNNVSFCDYYDLHLPPKQQEERILDNQSSLTSEEFFDCLEDLLDDDDNPFDIYKSYSSKNIEMDSNLKYLSSFDKSMISRLNVNIHDVRIFT